MNSSGRMPKTVFKIVCSWFWYLKNVLRTSYIVRKVTNIEHTVSGFKIMAGQRTMYGQNGDYGSRMFHFFKNCNILNKPLLWILYCHNLVISFS